MPDARATTAEIPRAPLIDPVCGMAVAADAAITSDHGGLRYGFCHPGCKARFDADPARWLGASMQAAPAAAAGALYTCPMDPDVRRVGPGSCPRCGMALEPMDPGAADAAFSAELRAVVRRTWLAAACAIPVAALAMGPMIGLPSVRGSGWIQMALSGAAVFGFGAPILARAVDSLRARSPNMFTLVALGVLAAYGASLWSLAARAEAGPLYFESAAVIVTLVLTGQALELGARRRTAGALRALLDLAPPRAVRVEADGQDREVDLDAVHVGDVLRVRGHDVVPVDGVVLEGSATLDESLVTGESLPVTRGAGERVIGATRNFASSFTMRAERVGRDTTLAAIVEAVAQAQRTRAPIQDLADRVAARFVPGVIGVAALATLGWLVLPAQPSVSRALVAAISVLIIACPCALGLATPMSIVVGTSRGAGMGILFRDAAALQTLARIDLLFVDKTGTLTEGRPRVVHTHSAGRFAQTELLCWTASLERSSSHPLSRAFVARAAESGLTLAAPTWSDEVAGQGLIGEVAGRRVAVGSERLFETLGLETSPWTERIREQAERGCNVTLVAVDGVLEGLFALRDEPRATSAAALAEWKSAGVEVAMLTGDSAAAAHQVARELGIARVEARVEPSDKEALVRAAQEAGRTVAMAGDGINDAPALARADVGVAMGSGADIAKLSAPIVLVRGDLASLARARRLSRATLRNIRQNLLLAFAYNAVCIPVAAGALFPWTGVLLSPMLAAAAMTTSSLSVILNALRLRRAAL